MRLKSEAKEHFHSFKPQRTRQRGTRLVEKGRKGIGVRNVKIASRHLRFSGDPQLLFSTQFFIQRPNRATTWHASVF